MVAQQLLTPLPTLAAVGSQRSAVASPTQSQGGQAEHKGQAGYGQMPGQHIGLIQQPLLRAQPARAVEQVGQQAADERPQGQADPAGEGFVRLLAQPKTEQSGQ